MSNFIYKLKLVSEMLFSNKKQLKGFVNVFFYSHSATGLILSPQPLAGVKSADNDVKNYPEDLRDNRICIIDLSKIPPEAILWEK